MKTASFFTYSGPGRISIARWEPHGIKGYRRYPGLAPRADMLKMPYERYLPEYLAILERLDPAKVVEDLTRLAGKDEPHLLCWKRGPLNKTNFCHRRMMAEWLEAKLGMTVPEV